MRRARCASACLIPGSEARMRVSSTNFPPWIGVLKSTRMKTRFSRRSRSDILRMGMENRVGGDLLNPGFQRAFINATVASSIRLLKPHSLSYQEDTFTSVPADTLVRVASKIDEAGLWLKSIETSGSLLYSRMPLRSVSEACLAALLISSTVVARFAMKDRSTIDTLIVGTRIA